MMNYTCSAIVNDRYCETTVQATSDKQAWFKFSQVFGYKQRDFKVVGKMPIAKSVEQLSFNI